jgi:hypothetical protein
MTLPIIEKRTAAFEGGQTDFADLPTFGRPRDTGKVDAVRALVGGEGYLFQKKIACILGIQGETMKSILRVDLNVRKANFKWLSHALNSSQASLTLIQQVSHIDFYSRRRS